MMSLPSTRSGGARAEQQVAVVTGGAGNIGLAIATVLLERGHSVVIADRDEGAVARLNAKPPADTSRLRCVTADITTEDGAQRAVQTAVDGFAHMAIIGADHAPGEA